MADLEVLTLILDALHLPPTTAVHAVGFQGLPSSERTCQSDSAAPQSILSIHRLCPQRFPQVCRHFFSSPISPFFVLNSS